MRAVVQRVTQASVTVDGELLGRIGKGLLILLGVADGDTRELTEKMADKICRLRIFEDEWKNQFKSGGCGRRASCNQPVYPLCRLPQGQPPQLCKGRSTPDGGKAL